MTIERVPTGHTRIHSPQPVHKSGSIIVVTFSNISFLADQDSLNIVFQSGPYEISIESISSKKLSRISYHFLFHNFTQSLDSVGSVGAKLLQLISSGSVMRPKRFTNRLRLYANCSSTAVRIPVPASRPRRFFSLVNLPKFSV